VEGEAVAEGELPGVAGLSDSAPPQAPSVVATPNKRTVAKTLTFILSKLLTLKFLTSIADELTQ
jgi:hypothetical protein